MQRPNAFLVIGIFALLLLAGSLLLAAPAGDLATALGVEDPDDARSDDAEPYASTIEHEFTPSTNGGLQREEIVVVPESSLRGEIRIRFEGTSVGPATIRVLDPSGRVFLESSSSDSNAAITVSGGTNERVSGGFHLEPGEWRIQFEGNAYARGVAVIESL